MSDETTRRLAAQVAAHESWASTSDRAARTAKARAALQARFENEVDPHRVLDPEERARRTAVATLQFWRLGEGPQLDAEGKESPGVPH